MADGSRIVIHPGAGWPEWVMILSLPPPLAASAYALRYPPPLPPQSTDLESPWPRIAIGIDFLTAIALVLAIIIATLLKMYGREMILVSPAHLRVERVLGPFRVRHVFSASVVSNVQWRERRIAKKHGSCLRKIVSFDASVKTIDLGT